MRLKAVSIPSFIWRPSSLAEPENGATIPKRISRSVTPRTFEAEPRGAAGATPGVTAATVAGGAAAAGAGGAVAAATGAGAATAADGPITPDNDGPASDCSRS